MLSERERVRPRKLGLRNPEVLLVAAQIIVVKIVKTISAAHAYLRLVPPTLGAIEVGSTDSLRARTTKQQKERDDKNERTHDA
jgi:hypothetical protein